MEKLKISTSEAPAAIGPYEQAIAFDRLVFCSGQIALDPTSGEIAESDAASQTERVLDQLSAVLKASGSSMDRVLKCTVYLVDMADFPVVNSIYARYFPSDPPARETVAVCALPKGARVEISCIAYR